MTSWLAGVACTELAFPDGTPMCGFAARTLGSSGVHDPLSVRAIAITSDGKPRGGASIIVVADLTAISPAQARNLARQIAGQTGLDPDGVVVAVTHTHAAPQVDPSLTARAASDDLVAAVEGAIIDTAVRAWQALEPVSLEPARGELPSVAKNRRYQDGPIDPTLDTLRIIRADGSTLAVVFSYACHPTVLGPDNHALSADWPGAARSVIEKQFPEATAIFLQGCCGDTNAGHAAHASMDSSLGNRRTYASAERMGRTVAAAVIENLQAAHEVNPGTVQTAQVPLPPLRLRATPDAIDAQRQLAQAMPGSDPVMLALAPIRESWVSRMDRSPETVDELAVTVHRWGGIIAVFLPGEPFGAVAHAVRALHPERHIIVVGYAGGVHGYVPHPDTEYDAGGYEVSEAHLYFGRASVVPQGSGAQLVVAAADAIRQVAGPRL